MSRTGLLLVAAAGAALVVAAREPTPSAAPARVGAPPTLGIEHVGRRSFLVRVDPGALLPRPGGRLGVGTHTFAWSFTRDGARLALAGDVDSLAIPSVLVVDTRRLRSLGRVRVARSGWVRATTWLRGPRLLAVVSVFESGGVRTGLVTVDGDGRKVLARRTYEGQILRVARTGDGLVVLVGAFDSLEAARLLVVDSSGAAKAIVVARILAGSERRRGGDAEFRQREPGLAVDPERKRAFVVDAGGTVAEVDLRTRAISYHRTAPAVSRLGRLRAWLEPAARAKSVEGPRRNAVWLGGGLLAVSGGDYAVSRDGRRLRYTPSGLELIDTRRWTVRRLGGGTDEVRQAGGLLLAVAATWSSELELPRPPGLIVYGADGSERYRRYDGERVWIVHADARRAYVLVGGGVDVLDLASGRVVERRDSVPYPLSPPGEPAAN